MEGALLHIYDPKVSAERIFLDLSEHTGKSDVEREENNLLLHIVHWFNQF